MFFKMISKDLKRKKAMNTVLLILLVLAAALVASSSNLMYSTSSAVNQFIYNSRVADFSFTIADTQDNRLQVEEWINNQSTLEHGVEESLLHAVPQNVTLPQGRKPIAGNTAIILLSQIPQDVNLVFGVNHAPFVLQAGEIAIPVSVRERTGIALGDKLTVDVGGIIKTYTVKNFFKDAFLGSDLNPLKRFFLSQPDFTELNQSAPQEARLKLWSFVQGAGTADNPRIDLTTAFSKTAIPSIFEFTKAGVQLSFMTDRILAAILFVVSLFLIFIAFLTLRFTIISSIQEEYKAIGLLKAIGFTNTSIKRLYLMKYCSLALVGGGTGLVVSIPLTAAMIKPLSRSIVWPDNQTGLFIAMLSVVLMLVVTLSFCLLCMRKINKASPIDAIRQGHTGERFKASWKISLHKSKLLPTPLFLAISDILNKLKGYTPLIITFVLSTTIILIPINVFNTMVTPTFISYFGVTQADFFTKTEAADVPVATILNGLERLRQEFGEHQWNVTLSVDYQMNLKYITDTDEGNIRMIGIKSETKTDQQEYLAGTGPKLANEIAVTRTFCDRFHKSVGDYVRFELDGKEQSFLLSGIFQTIVNGGYMARLADDYRPVHAIAYQYNGVIHAAAVDKPQILNEINEQMNDLSLKSAMEVMGDLTGGFMGQLKKVIAIIVAVVGLLAFFITSLFVRLLIAKEVKEIAVMKGLGFTPHQIRLWQGTRILILLLGSILFGVAAANILGERLVSVLFGMFGLSELTFRIIPLQVYVIYPFLILLVVFLAVYTSCRPIKSIQVWKMNED